MAQLLFRIIVRRNRNFEKCAMDEGGDMSRLKDADKSGSSKATILVKEIRVDKRIVPALHGNNR